MSKPKHNKENCEQLAASVIEGMSLETMERHLIEYYTEAYEQNEENFIATWDQVFGDVIVGEEAKGGYEDG